MYFLQWKCLNSIQISLKFVPKGPINNIPAFVRIMAWRRPGDKPLSEPMMARLPTHIRVTRPRWINLSFGLTHCNLGSCGNYLTLRISVKSNSTKPQQTTTKHESGTCPDSKVHGANMGPIWGRQDPGGPHVAHESCYLGNSCNASINKERLPMYSCTFPRTLFQLIHKQEYPW